MTSSTSSRPSCLVTTDICLRERSSRTTSLNLSGTIGRSGIRQVLNFGSYSSGSASCTRWPTAHVTTWSGPSRKPSCFLNGPFRTRARSPPTEGFSAITRVFDMAPSVAAGDFAGARGPRRGSRRTAAGWPLRVSPDLRSCRTDARHPPSPSDRSAGVGAPEHLRAEHPDQVHGHEVQHHRLRRRRAHTHRPTTRRCSRSSSPPTRSRSPSSSP